MNGWMNKLRSVVRGPSWIPGLSWTGHDGRRASVMVIILTVLKKNCNVLS